MTLTPEDLAAMRAAAEAVAHWLDDEDTLHVSGSRRVRIALAMGGPKEHMAQCEARATHIASASPARVIALLDRLARAEEALRKIADTRWDMGAADACVTMIKADARATLSAAEAEAP